MDWDFTENIAFKALYEAFKDSGETSALEFLSSDGASYYLELTQDAAGEGLDLGDNCLLYTSPSPRDATLSRMPSSA